jgi:hypothetical protein
VKNLGKLIRAGVVDHSFATVPAGVTLTREIIEALWKESQINDRKLSRKESTRVIKGIDPRFSPKPRRRLP